MKLQTRNFGEIDFNEQAIITFENGIPGFNELKKYILIEDQEENSPFSYLQSVEDGNISFILANPYTFKKDYRAEIKEEYVAALGGGSVEDFSIYVIVTLQESIETATLNLLAPIILQAHTKKAKQVILEHSGYTTRHKLLELLNEERG